jgi:hypothetical protein
MCLTSKHPLQQKKTWDSLVLEVFESVQGLHTSGFLRVDAGLIVCLGFFSDSCRTDCEVRRQVKGTAQCKSTQVSLKCTNSFLLALRGDGKQFPSMMFTHALEFEPTHRGYPALLAEMKKRGIGPSRIVFEKSKKQYCGEKAWMTQHFEQLYHKDLECTHHA